MGPITFLTVQEFIWYNCSAVCGSSALQLCVGVNGDLLKRAYVTRCMTQISHTQSPCPWGRPLLTCTSTGNTEILKGRSGSVSVGSLGPGAHMVMFKLSKHLWKVWSLILNVISPALQSCWGFSFALGCGVSFFFCWDPTLSCCWLFSNKLQLGISCRRRWAHVFLLFFLALFLHSSHMLAK